MHSCALVGDRTRVDGPISTVPSDCTPTRPGQLLASTSVPANANIGCKRQKIGKASQERFYLPCYSERLGGGGECMQDYQIHLGNLRRQPVLKSRNCSPISQCICRRWRMRSSGQWLRRQATRTLRRRIICRPDDPFTDHGQLGR